MAQNIQGSSRMTGLQNTVFWLLTIAAQEMVRELKGIIDKQISHLLRPWAKKRACCIRPVFYAED
jgi:hypothetical protein